MAAPKPSNQGGQKPSNQGGQKPSNQSGQKPSNQSGQKPSNSSSQKSISNVENYVTTNRFYIEIEENTVASFSECSGISIDVEKEVYQEGGVNDQQRISLGHTRFSDITLKRGTTDDNTFSQWLSELFEQTTQRRNVNIVTYNQAGDIMKSWCLIGAIPVGWKLPSLEANGNTVAVEELTLAFEGLKISKQSAGGDAVSRDATGYFAESAWE
ncbi:MAG: phage tail protein [Nostoc indistinguendum CM1-VF10]|jgi:phage tail-like protein|nr:phage tail protein [Nostoc indistinguendum CM1-VF10]